MRASNTVSYGVIALMAAFAALVLAGCGGDSAARSAEAEADAETVSAEVVVDDAATDAADDSADNSAGDAATPDSDDVADDSADDDSSDTDTDTDTDTANSAADGGLLLPESSIVGRLRSNLGVNICVTNSSSKNITVRGREGHYDSAKGQGVLQPGQEACFEGTSVFDEDVWVDVQTRNDRIVWTPLLMGNNPWTGRPTAYVYKCMDDSGFDEGKSRSWDSGIVAFDIKREADSGWKQFRVNITDSANPLPPNTTPDCWGPSGT